jgi:hypothetical protein
MQHIIQKQVMDFRLHGIAGDARIMDQLSNLCHRVVRPAVESVFDSYPGGSEYLIIDKLVLNLGSFTIHELHGMLETAIVKVLKLRLHDNSEFLRSNSHDSSRQVAVETDSDTEYLHQEEAELQLLASYLATGALPWWSGAYNLKEITNIIEKHLHQQPEKLRQVLFQLPANTTAKRLAIQFDTSHNWRLISLLAQQQWAWGEILRDVVAVMHENFSPNERKHANASLMEKLLGELISAKGMVSSQAVYRQIGISAQLENSPASQNIVEVIGQVHELLQAAANRLSNGAAKRIFIKNCILLARKERNLLVNSESELEKIISQQAKQYINEQNPEIDKTSEQIKHGLTTQLTQEKSVQQDNNSEIVGSLIAQNNDQPVMKHHENAGMTVRKAARQTDKQPPHSTLRQAPVEKFVKHLSVAEQTETRSANKYNQHDNLVYIDNAGLILLWQYIPRYFESLGLVRDGCFLTEAKQARAVLLLHYLAGFATEFIEEQLTLSKILCGLDTTSPVPVQLDPTEHERHEAEELLFSVIGHWTALGTTSVAGLQGAFLHREGRLLRNDLGWQLLVERKAYDLLLDKLPWGFGLIRLKWMQQTLSVEW